MKKLTRSQARKVRKAIRLARRPGKSEYRDKHGPQCVMGQLYKIEGLPYPEEGTSIDLIEDKLTASYPRSLLSKIQETFDSPYAFQDDESGKIDRKALNKELIGFVKEYESSKP